VFLQGVFPVSLILANEEKNPPPEFRLNAGCVFAARPSAAAICIDREIINFGMLRRLPSFVREIFCVVLFMYLSFKRVESASSFTRPRDPHATHSEFDVYAPGAVSDVLKGQHLVMVGDSLMRYQYINLIYFIENKKFPEMIPNICRENDYNRVTPEWLKELGVTQKESGWPAYYIDLSRIFNGNERCDCYRSLTENRFYYNEQLDIRVSFFLKYNSPIPGHNYTAESTGPPGRLDLATYNSLNRPPDWEFEVPALLQHLIKGTLPVKGTNFHLPKPTIILYNECIWNDGWSEKIPKFAKVLADEPDIFGIWKIGTRATIMSTSILTAYLNSVKGQKDLIRNKYVLGVFDSFRATKRFATMAVLNDTVDFNHFTKWPALHADQHAHHWDMYHFQPWVNNVINLEFLQYLSNCKIKPKAGKRESAEDRFYVSILTR